MMDIEVENTSLPFYKMGLTFIQTEKLILPVIVCDVCGERLYAGNALVLWNEGYDIKFCCKGKCSGKFEEYLFNDMIELYFTRLCFNSRLGVLKKPKTKWWNKE